MTASEVTMEGVVSNSSFLNLVWFQEALSQWNTIEDSGSIALSEESKVLLVTLYIQSQLHTNYDCFESM
jgi:hypothetical protein